MNEIFLTLNEPKRTTYQYDYNRARYYDTRIGRFIEVDPKIREISSTKSQLPVLTRTTGGGCLSCGSSGTSISYLSFVPPSPELLIYVLIPQIITPTIPEITLGHPYTYCKNNPLRYKDPTGFVPKIYLPDWVNRCPIIEVAVNMANKALAFGRRCREFWKCVCGDRSPHMYLELKTYHPLCLVFDMWTHFLTPNTIAVCEKLCSSNDMGQAVYIASLLLHEIAHHCKPMVFGEDIPNQGQSICTEEIW